MTTLYTVWYPDYSNSSPGRNVYTNRDHAYAEARAGNGEVVELQVDPPLSEKVARYVSPGMTYWEIAMGYGDHRDTPSVFESTPEEVSPADGFSVAPDRQRISTGCWARSREDAMKIANERLTRWMANGNLVYGPVEDDGRRYGWMKALLW